MPLDPSIYNQIQNPDYLGSLSRGMQLGESIQDRPNRLADLAAQRELRQQQVTQGRREIEAYPQQQEDAKAKRLFDQQTQIGGVLTKLQQSIAMGNVSDEAIKQQAAQAKQYRVPDAIIQQTFGAYLKTPAEQRAAIAQGHVTDYAKWFEVNNPKPAFSDLNGGYVQPPTRTNPQGSFTPVPGMKPKIDEGTPVKVMENGKAVQKMSKSGRVIGEAITGQTTAPSKPLPAAALKMQQEELDAIGTASGINSDLGAIKKQIEGGTLKLSFSENIKSKIKNQNLPLIGGSDETSRNFATFKATLEKLRNDSLRLNKGVQTDGDAQRAWNELMENISDPKVVTQRMGEIQKLNERAVQLRKLNIDNVRANYGHDSLDVSGYENLAPALGGAPVKITNDADYNALPSGTEFIAPDGSRRVKP